MPTIVIKTNASQATDVLIRDLGFVIAASGGSETFTDAKSIYNISRSLNLRTLATDNAHGANSSTLILNDGTNDISQSLIDQFLAASSNPPLQLDLAIGGSLSSAGTLPVTDLASSIIMINRTLINLRGRRGIAGTSGTTTVQLELNGSPIAAATLSWTSADAAFSLKTATFSQVVVPGDRLSLRLTARESGNPQDIYVEVD